ncbi:MAG: hypothetical protein NZ555_15285 [Geminicoccaceae bacterium]|nr:hypothetical protein [Geminicoccaceae bacterium]MCX8100686.1 hypothetical protein [Geminicoccaceae bacterium]MDW8371522.1 hypothetical protein [Geminicoccaceae bacterium]
MNRRAWLALALQAPLALRSAIARVVPADPLFGAYVGTASVLDESGQVVEERDLDLSIEPFRRTGLRLRTISVSLVDGRRDRPGVVRRESETRFLPASGRPYLVEDREPGLFRQREELQPMAGDPVRWAVVDTDGLHVYAFVLLEDGRYELQVAHRRPTAEGLELDFLRIVDGRVVRRARGRMVRAG